MAGQLGALAALAQDRASVPSTHIRWLTNTGNTSSSGAGVLFWPLQVLHAYATHTDKQAQK